MTFDEQAIRDAAPAELPGIIGDLAKLHALALARLVTTPQHVATQSTEDVLLSAEDAAKRLGLTPTQLLRKRGLPFRRKLAPKTIRFSARGIERYLKRSA